MRRRVVQVIQCRIGDIGVGDVVNRDPTAHLGWFEVANVSTLLDGRTQLTDASELHQATGGAHDIVGVQVLDEVAVDADTGYVVKEMPVVAAPAPMAPPAPAPAPCTSTSR